MNILLFQRSKRIFGQRDVCLQHYAAPNLNGSRKDHVMAKRALPSPEVLRQLLRYEAETGKLFWLPRGPEHMTRIGRHVPELAASIWNDRFAGKEAFTATDHAGYKCGSVQCHQLRAHRVAWAVHYGAWPENTIDHIDGCRANNSISNLRDVSHKTNCQNTKRPSHNTSGHIGVARNPRSHGKWVATIKVDGRLTHLGTFSSYDEAVSARKTANIAFGFGPSHGA